MAFVRNQLCQTNHSSNPHTICDNGKIFLQILVVVRLQIQGVTSNVSSDGVRLHPKLPRGSPRHYLVSQMQSPGGLFPKSSIKMVVKMRAMTKVKAMLSGKFQASISHLFQFEMTLNFLQESVRQHWELEQDILNFRWGVLICSCT